MLGEDIDKQLQLYLQKVRDQGGVITASVVVAVACGILLSNDRSKLVKFGGHIELSRQWAYSVLARMKFVHRKAISEGREKEGTNFSSFHEFSRKRLDISHMFLVSSCASLCWENGCHVCLWLGCEFTTLYNAKILFHTQAHTFFIRISRVVTNMESKFHLCTTCGR